LLWIRKVSRCSSEEFGPLVLQPRLPSVVPSPNDLNFPAYTPSGLTSGNTSRITFSRRATAAASLPSIQSIMPLSDHDD
jgi:hypothetical protein